MKKEKNNKLYYVFVLCFCVMFLCYVATITNADELNNISILLEKSDAVDLAINIINEKVNLFENAKYVCVFEFKPNTYIQYDVTNLEYVEFIRNLYLNTISTDSNLLTEAYVIESIYPFFKENFLVIKRSTWL